MNKFLTILKLSLISILITSLLLLSIISFNIYQKESSRVKLGESVTIENNDLNSKKLVSGEKEKELDLENLNSSIKETSVEVIDKEDFASLKEKRKAENELKNRITKLWKKPFNYNEGDGCFVTLYFRKDNNYRYTINDCVNKNAIVKRSIEVALLEILENQNINKFQKYKKSNKLKIFVYWFILK